MDESWNIAERAASEPDVEASFDTNGRASGPSRVAPIVELCPHHSPDRTLLAAWRELADDASEPNVFFEADFLTTALSLFDPGQDARIAAVWDGAVAGRLLGLIPLTREPRYGRWPVPVLSGWMHHNCFLGTPLVRKGCERAFWQALLGHADRNGPGLFLHLTQLSLDGPVWAALREVCAEQGRACDVVRREERALLATDMDGADYYAATVRKKKRKEIGRLRNRLAELGHVETVKGPGEAGLERWIDEFLALEKAGWKGENGSALACHPGTEALFRQTLAAAHERGRLQLVAMRLDGRAIAMLVSFLSPPGGFSFKTAYDEELSRYSPGVLLQIDNLDVLKNCGLAWMDSCAAAGHPMIDSLWAERRAIGRVSIALKHRARPLAFKLLRTGEEAMARLRAARRSSAEPQTAEDREDQP